MWICIQFIIIPGCWVSFSSHNFILTSKTFSFCIREKVWFKNEKNVPFHFKRILKSNWLKLFFFFFSIWTVSKHLEPISHKKIFLFNSLTERRKNGQKFWEKFPRKLAKKDRNSLKTLFSCSFWNSSDCNDAFNQWHNLWQKKLENLFKVN